MWKLISAAAMSIVLFGYSAHAVSQNGKASGQDKPTNNDAVRNDGKDLNGNRAGQKHDLRDPSELNWRRRKELPVIRATVLRPKNLEASRMVSEGDRDFKLPEIEYRERSFVDLVLSHKEQYQRSSDWLHLVFGAFPEGVSFDSMESSDDSSVEILTLTEFYRGIPTEGYVVVYFDREEITSVVARVFAFVEVEGTVKRICSPEIAYQAWAVFGKRPEWGKGVLAAIRSEQTILRYAHSPFYCWDQDEDGKDLKIPVWQVGDDESMRVDAFNGAPFRDG